MVTVNIQSTNIYYQYSSQNLVKDNDRLAEVKTLKKKAIKKQTTLLEKLKSPI